MFFDILFSFVYFFLNPYRTARKFLEKKINKTVYEYGETPLTQMSIISKQCDIKSTDRILELGSGRGKFSFWLYFFKKCNIVAIEQIPIFISIAKFFVKLFKVDRLNFICLNFNDYEIKDIDVIYLYGTMLSDEKIQLLINKFKKLSASARIITISYSLNDYDKSFMIQKSFDLSFPWGKTKAYVNIKRS
ncbi:MAG: class I SAM-dependent methyltransferase [Parachlamydiales bacterium]